MPRMGSGSTSFQSVGTQRAAVGVLVALVVASSGCSLPAQRADFESVDPAEQTLAVARVQESGLTNQELRELVERLDADDPALRMLAIQTLEMHVGDDFGYDFSAPPSKRRPAIDRWQEYAEGAENSSGAAGSPPSRVGP